MKRLWPLLLLPLFGLVFWVGRSDPDSGEQAPVRGGDDPDAPLVVEEGDREPTAPPPAAALRVHTTRSGEPVRSRVEVWASSVPDFDVGRPLVCFDLDLPWLWGGGEPVAAKSSDDDGRAAFPDLPDGRYALRAVLAGGEEAFAWCLLKPRDRDREEVIEFSSGPHSLAGVAVWPDGRPFHGLIAVDVEEQRALPPARTDVAGHFELRGLIAGFAELTCAAGPDFRASAGRIRIPFEGTCRVVVGSDASLLIGRVLVFPDDRPVPDATVVVTGGGRWPRAMFVRTRTDATGRFEARVTPDDRHMEIRAEGFATARRNIRSDESEVTIRLTRCGRVSGRVVAKDTGRGVSGAVVRVGNWRFWQPHTVRPVVSGSGGEFEIEGADGGEVHLYVLGGGWASEGIGNPLYRQSSPFKLDVAPGGSYERTLPVLPAVRVAGTVLDASGAPVADARIRCVGPPHGLWVDPPEAYTSVRGTFLLEDFPPGVPFYLGVSSRAGVAPQIPQMVGGPGETIPVTVRLLPARWLKVTVREASTGVPLDGVSVSAHSEPGLCSALTSQQTAIDGTARVGPLSRPEVYVGAYDREFRRLEKGLRLRVPPGETAVELVLERAVAIVGRVGMPGGALPDPECNVYVELEDAENRSCDARGNFRFVGLEPGRYRVRAWARFFTGERCESPWVEVEAGATDVRLVLSTDREEPTRTVESSLLAFRVLGPDGDPVPRALLGYTGTDANGDLMYGDTTSVIDGKAYGLDVLFRSAESVTLEVKGAQGHSGTPLPFGPLSLGPIPLEEGEIVLTLPWERTITGMVTGESGAPLSGVRIEAHRSDSDSGGWRQEDGAGHSGPDGTFRIGGLGGGEYMLLVYPPAGYLDVEPPVHPSGTAGVRIVLPLGDTARVTLLDPDGNPVPGAALAHPALPGGLESFVADRHGRITVPGMNPAAGNLVSIDPPSDRRDLLGLEGVALRPGDQEIRLPRGYRVSGSVPEGVPETARVWARGGDRDWVSTYPDLDGRFTVDRLPAGSVFLLLLPESVEPSRWGGAPVVVPAGSRDVRLPYDPGRSLDLKIHGWDDAWETTVYLRILEAGIGWTEWVKKGGRAHFEDLPSDRPVSLWVGPVGKGLYAWLPEVPPRTGVLDVNLRQGGTVRGTLKIGPGVSEVTVSVRGPGGWFPGEVGKDGTFVVHGVPDGEWDLRVSYSLATTEKTHGKFTRVEPGDELSLTLDGEEGR